MTEAGTATAARWPGRVTAGVLLLYAAFRLHDFLAPGLPLLIDAHSHVARAGFAAQWLERGLYPDWSFAWYGGYRLLSFYGPLYHSITGALGLALGDVVAATKWVVFGGQLAAVAALYALVRRLGCGPAAAALGALVFLESAQRAVVMGGLATYPVLGLLLGGPLLLWQAVRSISPALSARRLFAGQAIVLAAILLTHFGNALLALPPLLAFGVGHLLVTCNRADRTRGLVALGLAPLAAAALTAFGAFDALARLSDVTLSLDRLSLTPERGFTALEVLSGLSPPSFYGRFWVQPVAPLAGVMALAGLGLSPLGAGSRLRPAVAGLAFTLAVLVAIEDRAAVLVPLFVGVLGAGAVQLLGDALAQRSHRLVCHLLPLAIIALLLGFRVDSAVPSYAPADALAIYERLPDDGTPSRSFDVTSSVFALDGLYGASSLSPLFSGRAIPFGAYPQAAPLASNGLVALTGSIALDLSRPSPALSEHALDVLYLANVGVLVDRGDPLRLDKVSPPPGARRSEPGVLVLPNASPALFAPGTAPPPLPQAEGHSAVLAQLEPRWEESSDEQGSPLRSLAPIFRVAAQPDDWQVLAPLLTAMQIDRGAATAALLFVDTPLELPPGSATAHSFEILGHEERLDHVEIEARAQGPGALRLSYAWDPDLRITLDGTPVAHVRGSLAGAVVLAFPSGHHTVELHRPGSRLRGWLLAGSCAGVLLLVALMIFPGRLTAFRGKW